ncbi:MAG: hypothetical protein O3C40_31740 [Planctomycetota bacterium]|nr:hypothetical protein [Planctomycetota bacterium]
MDADESALAGMIASQTARIEAQRRDYAERSRRLNNFFVRTMTDQTGAIIRRERVKMVDFELLGQIVNGEDTPTQGRDEL